MLSNIWVLAYSDENDPGATMAFTSEKEARLAKRKLKMSGIETEYVEIIEVPVYGSYAEAAPYHKCDCQGTCTAYNHLKQVKK